MQDIHDKDEKLSRRKLTEGSDCVQNLRAPDRNQIVFKRHIGSAARIDGK